MLLHTNMKVCLGEVEIGDRLSFPFQSTIAIAMLYLNAYFTYLCKEASMF
jgi:hypothetical protein